MKLKVLPISLLTALLFSTSNYAALGEHDVNFDNDALTHKHKVRDFKFYASLYEKKSNKLDRILQRNQSNQKKIKAISKLFLNSSYVKNRLIGSDIEKERFVADFRALDCFTFLDYVEALRKSYDFSYDFSDNLINTRYKNSEVDFLLRKHFFSDWTYVDDNGDRNAEDVTEDLTDNTKTIQKELNQKEDGGTYIKGLAITSRKITYIPGESIDDSVVNNLKNGDYIGIYTNIKGLDVTHTGIFIRGKNGPVYRNASSISKNMKVVDTPFLEYVQDKPGIVVYRAL